MQPRSVHRLNKIYLLAALGHRRTSNLSKSHSTLRNNTSVLGVWFQNLCQNQASFSHIFLGIWKITKGQVGAVGWMAKHHGVSLRLKLLCSQSTVTVVMKDQFWAISTLVRMVVTLFPKFPMLEFYTKFHHIALLQTCSHFIIFFTSHLNYGVKKGSFNSNEAGLQLIRFLKYTQPLSTVGASLSGFNLFPYHYIFPHPLIFEIKLLSCRL